MQINRVELRDIKNHVESDYTFQPGVIAICGPNGSGKTTILEAIAWALFDHLDYKRDDFVRRGAKKGQVAVTFTSDIDGRQYVVTRDTGGGYFVYDPSIKTRLIEQKNQVVPWLRQQIGVEPGTDLSTLFKTTIGVPQGAFTYDFTLAPSNRKSVFDQILKVEEYRRASDNLRETQRHLDGRISEFERDLAAAEGELKAYHEIKTRHAESERDLKNLAEESRTTAEGRNKTGEEAARYDELKSRIVAQQGEIERLVVRLDFQSASLITARESAEQAQAAARTVLESQPGYETYLAASQKLAEFTRLREIRDGLRQELTAAERDLIEARSHVLRSADKLKDVVLARENLEKLSDGLNEQVTIESELARLRESRGEIQVLKSSRTSIDRELEKLSSQSATISREVDEAEARREKAGLVSELEARRVRLEEEIAQKNLELSRQQIERDQFETLERELARIESELDRNRSEAAQLEALEPLSERLPEIEARQQSDTERLAQLRAELARDQEMITALESGGICPLLTEKCLNLKPGESLDGRFRAGLESRRIEIERLRVSTAELAEEARRSRVATTKIAGLSKMKTEIVRLEKEIAHRRDQLNQIGREISDGDQVTRVQLENLKSGQSELERELREAHEAERIFNQARVLRDRLEEISRESAEKRAQRDELDQRLARLGEVEARMIEAENRLESLGDPRSRAAALKQVIDREQEWRREAAEAEKEVALIDERIAEINGRLAEYNALDGELATATQARISSERDYHAFIANQKIAATLEAREHEMAGLSSEIRETETALADGRNCIAELEKNYDPERHAAAQHEFDRLRELSAQISTRLEHTQQQFDRLQSQLDHLEQVRQRMSRLLAQKESVLRVRETTDFVRDILQKAAPFITESYLYSISTEANQLYREITGRYDVTLRWNKDYEIMLEEEGRERPFLNLSGGEQMAAALAVRLALLKELSEINLAFFDEPTANMDEERRRNLAQQIGRIKDFQQLFVISHDDSFEGYTDQIINLGERT